MDRWFAVHGAEEKEGSRVQNKQVETSIIAAYQSAEGSWNQAEKRSVWADISAQYGKRHCSWS